MLSIRKQQIRKLFIILLSITLILPAFTVSASVLNPNTNESGNPRFAPGEVIVIMNYTLADARNMTIEFPGLEIREIINLYESVLESVLAVLPPDKINPDTLERLDKTEATFLIKLVDTTEESVNEAIAILSKNPQVKIVERNAIAYLDDPSDDSIISGVLGFAPGQVIVTTNYTLADARNMTIEFPGLEIREIVNLYESVLAALPPDIINPDTLERFDKMNADFLIKLVDTTEESVYEAIAILSKNPHVITAEPNWISSPGGTHVCESGKVTIIKTPTYAEPGVWAICCLYCTKELKTGAIPVLSPEKTDAEFLKERVTKVLQNGLSQNNLRLDGKVLTLVIDGREFVLSTNANNRNVSDVIFVGDGYYLVFDIKGNGSNVKTFKVVQR